MNVLRVFFERNASDDPLDCIVGRSFICPYLELVSVDLKAVESAVPFCIRRVRGTHNDDILLNIWADNVFRGVLWRYVCCLYKAEARRTTPTFATFKPPRGLITTLW